MASVLLTETAEPQRWTVELPARLDHFLAANATGYSRSQLQKWIREGFAAVNGRAASTGTRLKHGDIVSLAIPSRPSLAPSHDNLDVVFEDDSVIVINKPAGMVTHPGAGNLTGTLASALAGRWPELATVGDPSRPGIVHRLDRDTSGLMVVARTEPARQGLIRQFAAHQVEKDYDALLVGRLEPAAGEIDAPIGRSAVERTDMAVRRGGKPAVTRYRVLEYLSNYSRVEAKIETGRTHQIRVHFAAIGHPVAADPKYGSGARVLNRQFLHAARLAFEHPTTQQLLAFHAALPADLAVALDRLRHGGEL